MKEIGLWLLDKLASIFPGLLLRRLYPVSKVKNQIIVDLCGEMPISLAQGATIPRIDLHLQIVNLSNLELKLDRMLLDLWFSQPTVKAEVLEQHKIYPRCVYTEIFTSAVLTAEQVKHIEPWTTQQPQGGAIYLNVKSYFNTKIGVVEIHSRFERRQI